MPRNQVAPSWTTNGTIWPTWCGCDSTTTTFTSGSIWSNWNSGITTATTSSYTVNAAAVWGAWNAQTRKIEAIKSYVETPEQRATREVQWRRYQQEQEERARVARVAKAEADARAEALLRAHLTSEQQRDLAAKDWFLIDSKSGKTYRINRGRSANIDVIDETGKTVKSLCVHPRDLVPDADTMLAQVLMLRYEEEELLRKANVHSVNHGFRRGPVPEQLVIAPKPQPLRLVA